MRLSKREHPEAREELRNTANWYEAEQPGLGEDFYESIDEAIQHMLDWPLSAPVFPGWEDMPLVRSMRVRVFPYRVLYYVTDRSVVILAYAHQRRQPGYWRHRLDS